MAPWNQIRLASPKFSRSDLAAEYYDHHLFKGATFADLMSQSRRPFLGINATDVGSGARFEFTQDEFDLIRSDLSRFPISRAVAASSALPLYLTPVNLKNYSAEQAEAEPEWIQSILNDPAASTRMRYVASQARSYVDGHRHFIHLVDGGFSDYLGLRGAIDRVIAHEQSTQLPSVPLRIPRRVALIVVDADRDFDYGWDSKEHPLGLRALLGSVGQVTVSAYSFETIELFREVMARLSRERTGSGDSQRSQSPPMSSNCTSTNCQTNPTATFSIPSPRRFSFLQRRWTVCASWPPASLPTTWNSNDCYLTFVTRQSNRVHESNPPLQPKKRLRDRKTEMRWMVDLGYRAIFDRTAGDAHFVSSRHSSGMGISRKYTGRAQETVRPTIQSMVSADHG